MTKIKLKEWAEKNSISYLTANRHFHAGMIPGAVQLDSGTILVEDDSPEHNMASNISGDAMSLFLKKTVEYSKNNSTVEDFAAYVISNFQLRLNGVYESHKNRNKSEEAQKHFQQFLPDKQKIDYLKAVKNSLSHGKVAGDVVPAAASPDSSTLEEFSHSVLEVSDNLNEIMLNVDDDEELPPVVADWAKENSSHLGDTVSLSQTLRTISQSFPTSSTLVSQGVDFNTPQQINYTSSTNQSTTSGELIFTNTVITDGVASADCFYSAAYPFQPTQKELLSSVKVEISEIEEAPRKRGRKPSKKREQ
ncbi:MAG TPA: hypothetical protein VII94_02355 [Candidatus Saccharimonadales bacterium]